MFERTVLVWPDAVQELGDRIAALTLVEAAQLKDYLKEVHRIEPAAGPVPAVEPPLPVVPFTPAAPQEFTVRLDGCDPTRKITVIKVVREVTGLGLKEAKDLVEGAPKPIRENVPAADAPALKQKLEAAGAKVSLVA